MDVMHRFFYLFAALLVTPFVSADGGEWVSESAPIMGTRVHVELFAEKSKGHELIDAVMAEMHRIDHAFSPYKPASELSQLNKRASAGWVKVSAELLDLLIKSRQISELTSGAFDITYASVGRYYDYRDGVAPDDETIAAKVEAIDYRHVELDVEGQRVRYTHAFVYVDLGGIAKGHAVDRGIEILRQAGVTQASISAGGDSRILGDRQGKPWTVGIRHPRDEDKVSVLLPLVDTAVSTSGDYERFFEKDGVRFHHILDPKTGRSATDAMSVTILGPDATLTDGLSTSVFVLGPTKGLQLINKLPGIDAIILTPAGTTLYSDDLTGLD